MHSHIIDRIALVEEFQHIVEPALNSDVKLIDSELVQTFQLSVRLRHYISDGGIHRDGFDCGEIFSDELNDLLETRHGDRKRIGADQINAFDLISIHAVDAIHLLKPRLDFVRRQHSELDILIHIAKTAAVMRTTLRHRQQHCVRLDGRAINRSVIFQFHC